MLLLGPICKLLSSALGISQLSRRSGRLDLLRDAFSTGSVNYLDTQDGDLANTLFDNVVGTCEAYCTCDVVCGGALGLAQVQGTQVLLLKDVYLI